MEGIGSGGACDCAGRKTSDMELWDENLCELDYMVVELHTRRCVLPEGFNLSIHYRIFNERA